MFVFLTIGGLIPCRISAGVPSGDCITAEPGLSKAIVRITDCSRGSEGICTLLAYTDSCMD